MPFLNLKLSAPLPKHVADQVAAVLTDLAAECLKKKRELTAVAVDLTEQGRWYLGGDAVANTGHPTFYLDVKVTEGTNTKDEKAHFVSAAFKALKDLLGDVAPASYVVIHELRADAWGYQGQSQELRYVASKGI
jgi:4-oxalocrotonate tautomerase